MVRRTTRLRILIAENHEVIRRGIRSLLEERPEWQICGEAASFAETIDQTTTLRPNLLLLDVSMPDMWPATAIPQIVAADPTIKIIGLSTQWSARQAATALSAGAHGLVLTTEAANDLVLTVENVLNDHEFLSPAAIEMIRGELAKGKVRTESTPTTLTVRELEIIQLLASGSANKEVAAKLQISVRTVTTHRANIMRKLDLRGYSDLIQYAIRHNLLSSKETT